MKDYGSRTKLPFEIAAGVIGGLAASWVMSKMMEGTVYALKSRLGDEGLNERVLASPEGLKPTEKAAVATARAAGVRLTKKEREAADPIIHYVLGGVLGAVYGALSARWPAASAARGTAYGTAVWLGADELALPLLRLSERPGRYPASTHALGLAAHLVYGGVLDAVSRVARGALYAFAAGAATRRPHVSRRASAASTTADAPR